MRLIQISGVISRCHAGQDALRQAKRLHRAYGVLEEFGYGSGPHISVIETHNEAYPYLHATIIWEST